MRTWNITTINKKENILIQEIPNFNTQILGLRNINKKGEEKTKLLNGYTPYFLGVNKIQWSKEGVGVIVTEEINLKIIQYKLINSRIITILFYRLVIDLRSLV